MGSKQTPNLYSLGIQDKELLVADEWEWTQTQSTTITFPEWIDTGSANLLIGNKPLYWFASFQETVTPGLSVTINVRSATVEPAPPAALSGTVLTHVGTGAISTSGNLEAGKLLVFPMNNINTMYRYLAVEVTLGAGADITAGMVTSGFATEAGSWTGYATGFNYYSP